MTYAWSGARVEQELFEALAERGWLHHTGASEELRVLGIAKVAF